MKKLFLVLFVFAGIMFAKTEVIELTGEHAKLLGNPFKKVLDLKKDETVNIYSQEKDIVLSVESNLERGSFAMNPHPDSVVLKNKTVQNVVKSFYSEDYNVSITKNDAVQVNVLSGEIYMNYNNPEQNANNHLVGITVSLKVEVIKDGKSTVKDLEMDHKLGKKGVEYKGFITTDDFDLSVLNLAYVNKIIENQIFGLMKGL